MQLSGFGCGHHGSLCDTFVRKRQMRQLYKQLMLLKSHKIIGIGDIQLLEHTLEVSVKQSKYGNETPLSTPPIFAPLTCTSEFGTTTKRK